MTNNAIDQAIAALEANNALEALMRIEKNNATMADMRGYGVIDGDDIETIRAALTRLSEIEPIIHRPVINVRPDIIEGAILFLKREHLQQPNPHYQTGSLIHQYYEAMRIYLEAANRIAKIGWCDAKRR